MRLIATAALLGSAALAAPAAGQFAFTAQERFVSADVWVQPAGGSQIPGNQQFTAPGFGFFNETAQAAAAPPGAPIPSAQAKAAQQSSFAPQQITLLGYVHAVTNGEMFLPQPDRQAEAFYLTSVDFTLTSLTRGTLATLLDAGIFPQTPGALVDVVAELTLTRVMPGPPVVVANAAAAWFPGPPVASLNQPLMLGPGQYRLTLKAQAFQGEGGQGGWIGASLSANMSGHCYIDCNNSGHLSIADFSCFQAQFVAQTAYADCNQDGQWTIADFACFQSAAASGCP